MSSTMVSASNVGHDSRVLQWLFLAKKVGFGPFWLKNLLLVDFAKTILFRPILTQTTGFGRFLPEKLIFADSGQETGFWLIVAQNSGFGQFWPKKLF